MRGTKSIISSGGPTVQLSSTTKSCYCCGKVAVKNGSLRISIAQHQPDFSSEEPQRTYLCLQCAGTISSSVIELITDEATKIKR